MSKDKSLHLRWEYGEEAMLSSNGFPFGANIHPIGSEMCEWMKQNRVEMSYFPHTLKKRPHAFTNPYTYNAALICIILSDVINECVAFVNCQDDIAPLDAEVQYIRLYSELAINSARFCEALLKQLLFCTNFCEGDYERAALDALISRDCTECRAAGKPTHQFSLSGSIGHRFGRCLGYEKCLNGYLRKINRRRNREAAHAGTLELKELTPKQSRAMLHRRYIPLGKELVHALQHIGDIELDMIKDINNKITNLKYKIVIDLTKPR